MNPDLTSVSDLLTDLVRIDSVNPGLDARHAGEAALARFVAEWAEERGLEVRWLESTPGRPSVIVTARGRGGTAGPGALLLNAHLDTVGVTGMERPFDPYVEGGRMYGRGTYDMKGSLAACLLAVAEAKEAGLAGDVILTAVADEENHSIGTREALAALREADVRVGAAIVTEPSDLQVHVAHRGFSVIRVELEGKASHTSQPEAGVNALTHLGRLLERVETAASALREGAPHELLGHGSLQPVLVEGGTELFTTPASAVLTLERRTVPGESAASAEAEVRSLLDELAAADPTFRAASSTVVAREPLAGDDNDALARQVAGSVEAVTGSRPELLGAPYWTDAALVAAEGIPTVLFGPRGGGIHQPVEWVEVESVDTVRRVLRRVAAELCG